MLSKFNFIWLTLGFMLFFSMGCGQDDTDGSINKVGFVESPLESPPPPVSGTEPTPNPEPIPAPIVPPDANTAINISAQVNVAPPSKISQTGIFVGDVAQLNINSKFIPYEVNQALWVDYSKKQNYIYLPPNEKIIFSENLPWGFPVGTIIVKHMRMETSFQKFQNLETRILVRKAGATAQNWEGYTYQWTGNDAVLLAATASPTVNISIDATAYGGAREQAYIIPSRQTCLRCHNSSVGYVRNGRTEQLNREYAGTNQLIRWNQLNLFDKNVGSINNFIKFSALNDQAASVDERIKTYLDVNCSHCHNPNAGAPASSLGFDLRYAQFNVEKLVASGHLVKGSKANSLIYQRMNANQAGTRMPQIGTQLKDTVAIDFIGKWIDGLK